MALIRPGTLALALMITMWSAPAQGQTLRTPEHGRWFLEAYTGLVLPLNNLEDGKNDKESQAKHLAPDSFWWPRFQTGIAGGGRVWDGILNLDVGMRLGLSFQQFFQLGETRQDYDPTVKILELTPFARANIFPFANTNIGFSLEIGLGPVFAMGGEVGSNDFPTKTQAALRLRAALGVIWYFMEDLAFTANLGSLVTDFYLTDEFNSRVGNSVALDWRFQIMYRF